MLTHLTIVSAAILVFWLMAIVQAARSLASCIRLYGYVRDALDRPIDRTWRPQVAVILPCCGLDNRLAETVEALGRQNYVNYEVVFVFESIDDPAYGAVGVWAAAWQERRWRRVVAGMAEHCSQKIHNLLAAVEQVGPECEVLAFLDSDAVPGPDWLSRLVAPLADPSVGATTGFRWYSASDGFANALRSAWNAASLLFVHDPRLNFCWGGSTAVRRSTFDSCGVAARWANALSDDYQMTRAVRESGLQIRFVPQCLIPCHESTGFLDFVRFARRQLIITRICGPRLWRAAVLLAFNYMVGTTATFVSAIITLLQGHLFTAVLWAVAWLGLLWVVKAGSMVRQAAVSLVLSPPAWTRRDWAADVLGSELLGIIHTALLMSSVWTRRISWRGTVYEMVSASQTRVISRLSDAARFGNDGARVYQHDPALPATRKPAGQPPECMSSSA